VIREDAWYIIPEKEIRGLKSISLCTTGLGSEAKYEQYREAWALLRKASEIGDSQSCVEQASAAESGVAPASSAVGGWSRLRNSLCVLWNGECDSGQERRRELEQSERKTLRGQYARDPSLRRKSGSVRGDAFKMENLHLWLSGWWREFPPGCSASPSRDGRGGRAHIGRFNLGAPNNREFQQLRHSNMGPSLHAGILYAV
jgi:hypothetical protein